MIRFTSFILCLMMSATVTSAQLDVNSLSRIAITESPTNLSAGTRCHLQPLGESYRGQRNPSEVER